MAAKRTNSISRFFAKFRGEETDADISTLSAHVLRDIGILEPSELPDTAANYNSIIARGRTMTNGLGGL